MIFLDLFDLWSVRGHLDHLDQQDFIKLPIYNRPEIISERWQNFRSKAVLIEKFWDNQKHLESLVRKQIESRLHWLQQMRVSLSSKQKRLMARRISVWANIIHILRLLEENRSEPGSFNANLLGLSRLNESHRNVEHLQGILLKEEKIWNSDLNSKRNIANWESKKFEPQFEAPPALSSKRIQLEFH